MDWMLVNTHAVYWILCLPPLCAKLLSLMSFHLLSTKYGAGAVLISTVQVTNLRLLQLRAESFALRLQRSGSVLPAASLWVTSVSSPLPDTAGWWLGCPGCFGNMKPLSYRLAEPGFLPGHSPTALRRAPLKFLPCLRLWAASPYRFCLVGH